MVMVIVMRSLFMFLVLSSVFICSVESLSIYLKNGTEIQFKSPSLFEKWYNFTENQAYFKKLYFDESLSCDVDIHHLQMLDNNDTASDYVYFGLFQSDSCHVPHLFVEGLLLTNFSGFVIGFEGGFEAGVAARSAHLDLPKNMNQIDVPIVELEISDYQTISALFNENSDIRVTVVDGENNLYFTFWSDGIKILFQIISWFICFISTGLIIYKGYLAFITPENKNKNLQLFLLFLQFLMLICIGIRTIDPFLSYGIIRNVVFYFFFVVLFWAVTTTISAVAILFEGIMATTVGVTVSNVFSTVLKVILIINTSTLVIVIITEIIVLIDGSEAAISLLGFVFLFIGFIQLIYFIITLTRFAYLNKELVDWNKYCPFFLMVPSLSLILFGDLMFILMKSAFSNYIFQCLLNLGCFGLVFCVCSSITEKKVQLKSTGS